MSMNVICGAAENYSKVSPGDDWLASHVHLPSPYQFYASTNLC